MQLAPVLDQFVLDDHSVRQEEREAWTNILEHEEFHVFADLAVITTLCLLLQFQEILKFLGGGKGGSVDSCQHLVFAVIFPVCAGKAGQFECFQGLCIGQVGTDAHIDVFALFIETQRFILIKVCNMFDLVWFMPFFHEF